MSRSQWRIAITCFLSIVLIVNNCLMLLGWHLYYLKIIKHFPQLSPIAYITAVGFIIAGLSLIIGRYSKRLCFILAIILAIISGVKLVEYIIYINLGISEYIAPHYLSNQLYALGTMSQNSAICFLLTSTTIILCLLYHKQDYLKICAFSLTILIAFLSLMPFVSHLTGTKVPYDWGNGIHHILISSINFIIISIIFLLEIWSKYRQVFNQRTNLPTILTLIISGITFLILWQMSTAYGYNDIKMDTYKDAKLIANNTVSRLSNYYLAAQGFLTDRDRKLSAENSRHWQQQVRIIIENFPSVISLSRTVDSKPMIIQRNNISRDFVSSLNNQCRRQGQGQVNNSHQLHTQIISSENGTYICLSSHSLKQTLIMNLSAVMEQSISPFLDKEYNAMVTYHNKLIYQSKRSQQSNKFIRQWQQTFPITIFNHNFIFHQWPSQQYIISHNSWLPEILVTLGLLITFLLSFSCYLLKVVREYNQYLINKVKKQSQDLRSSETRYDFLYENLPDMYASISEDGQIINCNKTLADSLGYQSTSSLIGINIVSLHDTGSKKSIIDILKQLKQSKKIDNIELKLKKRNGSYIPAMLKAHSIGDSETEIVQSMLSWRDISGQKALESDISQLKKTEIALSRKVLELDLIYQATTIASNSTDLQQTLKSCLKIICQMSQWPVGHVYLVNEKKDCLQSSKIWCFNHKNVSDELKKISEQIYFKKGEGVPGHIWQTEKVTWIESIQEGKHSMSTKDQRYQSSDNYWFEQQQQYNNFPRKQLFEEMGIHSIIGFPVILYGKVIAVLEFLSYFPEKEDEDISRIFHILGEQIGHVLERKNHEEKLEKLAHFDNLTQLPNRNYFHNELKLMLARAERNKAMIAVLFIDLDYFKHINDSLGHHHGDLLLKNIAKRIKHAARESDFIARIGGDEFVIVTDTIRSQQEASNIAERILQSCQHSETIGNNQINISLSIGIAIYPSSGKTAEEILRFADTAMYQAKTQGRNNYQFFTEDINKSYIRNITIEQKLKKALKNEELSIKYQPIIDSKTNSIYALEALTRWHHPQLGDISPEEFIPIAESYNLITDIGRWVFDQACQQLSSWQHHPLMKNIKVSVNCSPIQIKQNNFSEQMIALFEPYQIKASSIILEITETGLMNQIEQAITALNQLNNAGFNVAIDDFGTGYSSLSYLKKLPISSLKIDRSFVTDTDQHNNAIMLAIIQLAKALDLQVIAEGVENQQQLKVVESYGCHLIQGFYFAKPMTAGQCEDFAITINEKNRQ